MNRDDIPCSLFPLSQTSMEKSSTWWSGPPLSPPSQARGQGERRPERRPPLPPPRERPKCPHTTATPTAMSCWGPSTSRLTSWTLSRSRCSFCVFWIKSVIVPWFIMISWAPGVDQYWYLAYTVYYTLLRCQSSKWCQAWERMQGMPESAPAPG